VLSGAERRAALHLRRYGALKPQGVDPIWLAPGNPDEGRPLVLTINANGTYAFRSEAHNGAQAQAGSFAASNGRGP